MCNPELEDCPFCGSDTVYIRYGNDGHMCNGFHPEQPGYVQCWVCGCRTLQYMNIRTAIAHWNMRVTRYTERNSGAI